MYVTYRPEIDGLRAIAVSAVILYHANITILGFQPFKGGFIGVDIFFVISGYLITSIILKELVTTGSFSFKYFYERRIRRILPALLFVMLISLPFAWMYLTPSSFVDFSKSILYSIGFSSNFYFHFSGEQYGATSGLFKPMLHTWSLSVEEQYYILFPIVLLIAFRYFRKYLIYILIFGVILSLGVADWGSRNYPSFTFYALPTRAWELLAGSILAYFEIKNVKRSKNKSLNLIFPTLGLLLIGHSIVFFNDRMFHPSFYTLSPIIGVCLIIWFSDKNELITKILSTKLFVTIGLISYSLYLWHYPIFAFARIIEITQGSFYKLLLAIIVILLSIVSYYFIERPFRNKKNKFKKQILYILSFVIIIFIFNINVISSKGYYKERYNDKIPIAFEIYEENIETLVERSIGKNIKEINITLISNPNNQHIFLIGDSHAKTLSYGIWKEFREHYNINFSLFASCGFILNVNRVDKKTLKPKNCTSKLQQERLKFINKTNNSIVILFSRLPLILNEEGFYDYEYDFYESQEMTDFLQNEENSLKTKLERQENIKINFEKTIEELSRNNHNIILVYPMPEVGVYVPDFLFKHKFKKKYQEFFNDNLFTTNYELFLKRSKSSFELLDSIKGDNIFRVYTHKLFCDKIVKNRCMTHDEKNIFYSDFNHPTLKAAEMINNLIIEEIKKIKHKSQ
jgi:peptidoglycan/LPS O-acetylase OafA/YrhL